MAAVLDEVGKSAEKLVDEEKDEIVDEEDETGAVEASKKKKKKKKKKKAGSLLYKLMGIGCIIVYAYLGIISVSCTGSDFLFLKINTGSHAINFSFNSFMMLLFYFYIVISYLQGN